MGKSSENSIKTSELSKGERVRTLRKALGLNMEKFGERIGMAKTSISSIENGYSELTRRVAVAICREYNVSENWLETGEGEMFKEETEETKYYKRLIDEKFATSDDKFRSALLEIILQLDDEAVDVVKRYATKYLLPAMTGEAAGTIEADGGEAFAEESGPAAAGQESQPKHAGGAFAIDGATAAAGSESRPDQANAAFDDYEPTIEEKVEAYRQALLEEEALKKAGEIV